MKAPKWIQPPAGKGEVKRFLSPDDSMLRDSQKRNNMILRWLRSVDICDSNSSRWNTSSPVTPWAYYLAGDQRPSLIEKREPVTDFFSMSLAKIEFISLNERTNFRCTLHIPRAALISAATLAGSRWVATKPTATTLRWCRWTTGAIITALRIWWST